MRVYLAVIAALFVSTLIMAAPDPATFVAVATLGVGIPLVFSGAALLYALCALPLPALWGAGPAVGSAALCLQRL